MESNRHRCEKDSNPEDIDLMFHRIGLRVGAMIAEKEFERALIFCGTGMGMHICSMIWVMAMSGGLIFMSFIN